MVFDSYTFIVFILIVTVVHRLLSSWSAQKVWLLGASYVFYAAWNPPFVLLLMFTTVFDWFIARGLARLENPRHRRALLIVSLVQSLGLLVFFKYSALFVTTLTDVAATAGITLAFAAPDLVLPVGISFYTFHTLSFTIDVYRRVITPGRSFVDYALYVTFFPSLVAGPIVRAAEFLPQLDEPRRASADQLAWGITHVIMGLFAKVALADALLAPIADTVFNDNSPVDTVSAWMGTLAFAGQIFFDFAGYSACALGSAMMFGFTLSRNFRFPYAAIGFSDFWRRWHISLSSWLRDYLYVSLGGNRRGRWRTDVNLMTTMVLGGLWHGASWTFVAWGALHGSYLIIEKQLVGLFGKHRWPYWPSVRLLLMLVTFVLVCITWVFFRSTSFSQAFRIITSLAGQAPGAGGQVVTLSMVVVTTTITLLTLMGHGWLRDHSLEEVQRRAPAAVRAVVVAFMLVAIATASGETRAFIYFQF